MCHCLLQPAPNQATAISFALSALAEEIRAAEQPLCNSHDFSLPTRAVPVPCSPIIALHPSGAD